MTSRASFVEQPFSHVGTAGAINFNLNFGIFLLERIDDFSVVTRQRGVPNDFSFRFGTIEKYLLADRHRCTLLTHPTFSACSLDSKRATTSSKLLKPLGLISSCCSFSLLKNFSSVCAFVRDYHTAHDSINPRV